MWESCASFDLRGDQVGGEVMKSRYDGLLGIALALCTPAVVGAEPVDLFTEIEWNAAPFTPPLPDALDTFWSTLDVQAVAAMPSQIRVRIPRVRGEPIDAVVVIESMDRRDGFVQRDGWACDHGDPTGCEIIPAPNLPDDHFSYTWIGQGSGYDLRITVNHGHVVGILVGDAGRFSISRRMVKELNQDFFRLNDLPPVTNDEERPGVSASQITPRVVSPVEAQALTVKRIGLKQTDMPNGPTSSAHIDMLVLFTEEARRQAGGNPSICSDTAGVLAYIQQGINDVNTAFARSQIPVRMGVVTVAKLSGYTLIPDDGTFSPSLDNRNNLNGNANIKAFRNAVGADVVQVLFDTQTNLGPCGVAYVQRSMCTGQADPTLPSPCIGNAFKEHATYLNTVQCSSSADVFTHELGHVLGSEHDSAWGPLPSFASFPYAFGYFVSGVFQTVMSQQLGAGAPLRILQFSNPSVSYAGVPTGDAVGANNSLAITNLAPGVAGFRSRPQVIFANGFESMAACPSLSY